MASLCNSQQLVNVMVMVRAKVRVNAQAYDDYGDKLLVCISPKGTGGTHTPVQQSFSVLPWKSKLATRPLAKEEAVFDK